MRAKGIGGDGRAVPRNSRGRRRIPSASEKRESLEIP